MEYHGTDVAEAIKNACDKLNVSQDQLDIEVKATGSAGIFGLCRRKATILVSLREEAGDPGTPTPPVTAAAMAPATAEAANETTPTPAPGKERAKPRPKAKRQEPPRANAPAATLAEAEQPAAKQPERPLPPEAEEMVRQDLNHLLELAGLPSTVAVSQEGGKLRAHISGDHTDEVVGPAGQTLDAIQYLLRKMASKKFAEKVQLTLDAGDFRESRLQELEETAVRLAAEVRDTGKTQSIPALNPAERRIVHMALQNDTTIRSRSVGEGLFKKILIYLPGKGRRRGGKSSAGRAGNKPRSATSGEQDNE